MRALLTGTAPIAYASAPSMALTPAIVAEVRASRRYGDSASVDEMLKRSPDSAAMLTYWDKVDAIMSGVDGMVAAGETFLPQFADEDAADYKFRSRMVKMTNVFRDVVEGLASKPFAQNVTLAEGAPSEIDGADSKAFIWDVDGSGNTITIFAAETFFSGIANAIDWIFVDHPPKPNTVRNMADYKRAGLRPFWSHVLARNVLDARSKVVGGNEQLTYIKILEPGDPDRVRIFERADNGVVTWSLYERRDSTASTDATTQFIWIEGGTLSIDVIPLVPFITGRRAARTFRVFPMMQDAADLQVDLYQQESGLKYAQTLTAYPMLAANGISPPLGADGKPKLKVATGPNRVLWSVPGKDGSVGNWGYIEPSAQSLEFLAKNIERTIRELRELGRQPLTAQSGNITVITAAVAAGKAKSAVKAWAFALGNALEEALIITAKWWGLTYNPDVTVFTEFDEFTEGEDLATLLAMRESRDISAETLYEEMQRRSVLASTFTTEREKQRLLAELPAEPTDEGVTP